jgi:hypothetical protein
MLSFSLIFKALSARWRRRAKGGEGSAPRLRHVKLVIEEVSLKQCARIERHKTELDVLWFDGAVLQRLDPRIVGEADRQS